MKISFHWRKRTSSSPLMLAIEECLSKTEADKIKHLDIQQVLSLTTEERLKLFESLIGAKAEWFNERFEKDYVLRNQKAGLLKWAHQTKMKDKYRNDILRRISELEKALSPKEEEKFLEELAELALGLGVTREEEEKITELSNKANAARIKMASGASKEEYEAARHALDAYVEELKKS